MFRKGDFFEDWAADFVGIVLWFFRHSIMAFLSSATLLESTAANAVSGDLGEEALNHVEQGSQGRREVKTEAWMRL
ncbi:hypothetical protein ACVWW6_000158 [Bradyrhizobium sp. USDA 3311]